MMRWKATVATGFSVEVGTRLEPCEEISSMENDEDVAVAWKKALGNEMTDAKLKFA